jgi:hypothetical protein
VGLGASWRVVRTDFEAENNTFVICVTETEALWPEGRSKCGQAVSCYDHIEPMQWRHLNVFNKECVIVCASPRGKRSVSGEVYWVTPPWEGRSKHSPRSAQYIRSRKKQIPISIS